ncbi:MAG TPA: helix-turn-helix transcriptional regulator [Xanthobacteraceae bacterium]|nr:helix-turn-helix transcriptional regulator [Xanthobacteraceae bacterium]
MTLAPLTSATLSVSEWIKSCSELMLRGEHFSAADILSTRQRILEFSAGRSSFAVTDRGRFFGYGEAHARMGRVALRFLSWNCEAKCETETFRTPDHHIVVHIPLRGEFEASQDAGWLRVEPGNALVVSSAGVLRRRWEGQCDLLNLRIERDLINHVLADKNNDALHDLPLTIINLNQALPLARFVETIIHDLGSARSALADTAAAAAAEKLLALLLLHSLNKAERPAVANGAPALAPYYVRRAEQYVADNYMKSIGVADLETATGVSARTLYYGFKQYRGASPMKYLKGVRLMHARRRLLEAQMRGGRVGDIAAAVGYGNKSQFARDYKGYFGESPAATLRGQGR